MTTISAAASGLHQHHSIHPSDVDMLEAITTMPTLRQNGFHQHASSSSSASSSPSVHFDMPARKRNLDTLHALRRPPIDPIVLAASLSSGPHVTRHHFHHSFGPKVESKQMSRSQRVKLQEEEQKAEEEKAKRSAQGRHRAGSYANCDRDEVHDALRKAPSATQDVTPKVDGEVNAYFSKQAPRSERLRREQEAKEAVEKAKMLKHMAQPPDLTRLPSYQLDKELQERQAKIKTRSDAPSSLGAIPHSGQQSAVIEAPPTPAISSIVRPPPIHVRCYARTRIPTPHGEVFCHLYRNNRDNKEHLALVVDTAQNALGGRWEDAEEAYATMSTSIRSKTLDEVWGPHETEMERIVRGAYVGRLGPHYQVASKARRTDVDHSKSHDIPSAEAPLVRIHSECYTGETIGSQRCDCGEQLDEAIRLIHADSRPARGVVVYLRQEGRGIGLLDKLMAYNLQDMGHDTVSANILLGHLADARKYDVAAEILRDLGLSRCRLLTNNPEKMEALESEGISVEKRVPMVPRVWRHGLLERKRSKAKTRTRALEESIVSQMDLHPGSDIEDFSDDASDASRESYVDHVLRRAGATMLGGSMTRGPELEKYLRTKVERMGHLLDLPAEQASPNLQQSTEDYSDEDETALLTDEEHAPTGDDDGEEILIRERYP